LSEGFDIVGRSFVVDKFFVNFLGGIVRKNEVVRKTIVGVDGFNVVSSSILLIF